MSDVAALLAVAGWVWLITGGALVVVSHTPGVVAAERAPYWPSRPVQRRAASLLVLGGFVVVASFLLPWGPA